MACPVSISLLSPLCDNAASVTGFDRFSLNPLASRATGCIPCHAAENRWSGLEIPVVRLMFTLASRHHHRVVPAGNPSAGYGGRCVEALCLPV